MPEIVGIGLVYWLVNAMDFFRRYQVRSLTKGMMGTTTTLPSHSNKAWFLGKLWGLRIDVILTNSGLRVTSGA